MFKESKTIHFLLLLICACSGVHAQQVVTQHNDLGRTGWNPKETTLHKGNVKAESFGAIFSRAVDDQIYAQPLIARVDMPIVGTVNVVYVATVNNSIYAFDADSVNRGNPYWQVNLTPVGWRAMKNTETACGNYYADFSGKMGIVGTPAIDSTTNTMYVVTKSVTGTSPTWMFQQTLHSIDLLTGQERPNSPVVINAQANGSGTGNVAGVISFDAQLENQRAGLLLLNGVVYITWAAHGDCGNYHGWIIGYDKTTLAQKCVYNATPDGYQGGIWMAGAGLSADENGNIYASVGNGSVGTPGNPANPINRSESALKLTPNGSSLTVSSFFTPNNYPTLEQGDQDFGVTGLLLLPGHNQVFTGAKDGTIYLLDRDVMGGFNAATNQVLQTFTHNNVQAHNLSSLTYYKGALHEWVYIWSDNVPLKALPYNSGTHKFDLNAIVSSSLQGPVGYSGAFMSVSSNHNVDSTAILWVAHASNSCNANQQTCPGILRAINPNDVRQEYWNSSQYNGDNPGNYAKFNCSTIANGKVYLATFSNKLMVYGLRKNLITGIQDRSSAIHLYPNPASNYVDVVSDATPILYVTIMDTSGKIILQEQALGMNSISIQVGGVAGGFYIVEVTTEHGAWRQKLIIRK